MKISKPLFTMTLAAALAAALLATPAHAATPADEEVGADTLAATAPAAPLLPLIGHLSYDSILAAMPGHLLVEERQAELREAFEAELKRVAEDFNSKYESFLEGMKDFPRTILLKRQRELQQLLQQNLEFKREAQKELEQALDDALAPLRTQLDDAIATVAREKGLAIVVNTDSHACPFIDPDMGVDMTEAVMDLLGKSQ